MISLERSTLYVVPLLLLAFITVLSYHFYLPPEVVNIDELFNFEYFPEEQLIIPYTDSLSSLCNSTLWQPGLYINCTNIIHRSPRFENHGDNWGTFNIRSQLVSCLRWALDSGMGFVMPLIAIRSDYDLEFFPGWRNISHLFDEENFHEMLGQLCPQLQVRNTYTKIDNIIKAPMPDQLMYYGIGLHRRRTNNLLRQANMTPSLTNPVVIWENKALFGWVFSKEGIDIHNTLFKVFAFRKDLIEISQSLLNKIKVPFLGIHLRAEPDQPWYTYEELRDWCVDYLLSKKPHLKTVFVSIGNSEIEKKFKEDMKAKGVTVISKWTLSESNQNLYQELLDMDFDQSAVIDYQILLKSEVFLGVSESSFSYAVAFERGEGVLADCNCSIRGTFGNAFRCCY